MLSRSPGFRSFFGAAMDGREPYSWQVQLAEGPWPEVLIAPTGSGKTAGVTLAWLYHRLIQPDQTPHRLVWCLPMKTLVDQAAGEIHRWLERLTAIGFSRDGRLPQPQELFVLRGGMYSDDWLDTPERSAVMVGTQDMLLSRALMRGYASRRTLWPMQFALLHRDAQWIFDEVQLMGAGRATSAQLAAFRQMEADSVERVNQSLPRPSRSLWVSATLEPDWLKTVDFQTPQQVLRVDPATEHETRLRDLVHAPKILSRFSAGPESASAKHAKQYVKELAARIVEAHQVGRMTLVIVNQVARAQNVYRQLQKATSKMAGGTRIELLHSRFRPPDRQREVDRVLGEGETSDMIVVATQAVEAGVDISAAVMFTELAPWASMVQRFGRANRRAEVEGGAQIYWIDLLAYTLDTNSEKAAISLSRPYDLSELLEAREKLLTLKDVAPVNLPRTEHINSSLRVIRRKDLDELFSTDADLAGFDIDISPYVRDADDTDLRVFWRDTPSAIEDSPRAGADELCAVPIGLAKKWIETAQRKVGKGLFFVRDLQSRRRNGQAGSGPSGWVRLTKPPRPGLTIMADTRAGGYHEGLGFTGIVRDIPVAIDSGDQSEMAGNLGAVSDGHDEDSESATGRPVILKDHLAHVATEVKRLAVNLGLDNITQDVLLRAARWHDLGKAHEVFQATMRRGLGGVEVPEGILLAKTVRQDLRHDRAYFRHELVSALAFLAHQAWSRRADLGAYLIAAHHGKVRTSLRALPREEAIADSERSGKRFARGVWEGDELPSVELGGGEFWEGGSLTLSIMELGLSQDTGESWTERTWDLLRQLGPFQLAYLETLLRTADWRASRKETEGVYSDG